MICETITFNFDDEDQQRRFHERLANENGHTAVGQFRDALGIVNAYLVSEELGHPIDATAAKRMREVIRPLMGYPENGS